MRRAVAAEPRTPLPGVPHLLADGTSKTVGMVGLAQGGHHLSFHELPTAMAACPIHPLVVQRAEVLPVLYEEAALCQVAAAHCGETSSHLVTVCPAAGAVALCMLFTYSMISVVWAEGWGLAQRAIYYWALISPLPPSPFCFLSFGSYAISHTIKIHWPCLNDFRVMSEIQR